MHPLAEPLVALVLGSEDHAVGSMTHVLSRQGYRAVRVATTPALFRVLATVKVDLVVIDLDLLGPDGCDVVARVKCTDQPRAICCSNPEMIKHCDKPKCDTYLAKPFAAHELAALVPAADAGPPGRKP
jgi:DNA-binding response OmpR family regulator